MKSRSCGKSRTYRPSIEHLEDRIQLAAALTATLGSNGTLTIEGTNGADNIILRRSGGSIAVLGVPVHTLTGVASSVPSGQVQRIVINSLGGNDQIRLDS